MLLACKLHFKVTILFLFSFWRVTIFEMLVIYTRFVLSIINCTGYNVNIYKLQGFALLLNATSILTSVCMWSLHITYTLNLEIYLLIWPAIWRKPDWLCGSCFQNHIFEKHQSTCKLDNWIMLEFFWYQWLLNCVFNHTNCLASRTIFSMLLYKNNLACIISKVCWTWRKTWPLGYAKYPFLFLKTIHDTRQV